MKNLVKETRLTAALCVALGLAGCVSAGPLGPLPAADPSTAAELIVIREWHFTGGGFPLEIAIDQQPVYVLTNGRHVIIPVAPGEHLLSVRGGGNAPSTVLPVRAAGRTRYYFQARPFHVDPPSLQPVTAEAAQALMVRTDRVR